MAGDIGGAGRGDAEFVQGLGSPVSLSVTSANLPCPSSPEKFFRWHCFRVLLMQSPPTPQMLIRVHQQDQCLLAKCKSVLRWRLSIWDPVDFGSIQVDRWCSSVTLSMPHCHTWLVGQACHSKTALSSVITLERPRPECILHGKAQGLGRIPVVPNHAHERDRGQGKQQDLNHLDDGPEQVARDEKMRAFAKVEEQYRAGKDIDWESLSSSLSNR